MGGKFADVFYIRSLNESCLACVESEKYVVWVTLRPLGSIRQGEAELCIWVPIQRPTVCCTMSENRGVVFCLTGLFKLSYLF